MLKISAEAIRRMTIKNKDIDISKVDFGEAVRKFNIKIYSCELSGRTYPVADSRISAGFPAYAENFKTDPISIDGFLVHHPESTFIIEVSGESMIDAGIYPGSYIVVDTAIKPQDHSIVVARFFDEFLVKRLRKFDGYAILKAENNVVEFPDVRLDAEADFEIWGVVVGTFKKL